MLSVAREAWFTGWCARTVLFSFKYKVRPVVRIGISHPALAGHRSDVMSCNDLFRWRGEECLRECDEVSTWIAGGTLSLLILLGGWGGRWHPITAALLVSKFYIQQ